VKKGLFILMTIVLVLFAALMTSSCTKTNTVTGPSDTDTVTVIKIVHDTVIVTRVDTVSTIVDVKSNPDFFDALQKWINPQLSGLTDYYPTIGTSDVKISGTATSKTFEVTFVAVDYGTNQVWQYYGIFEAVYNGHGSFDFTDVTPAQSPGVGFERAPKSLSIQ
jgi:hypothetical protein